jgi:hypothetical protein
MTMLWHLHFYLRVQCTRDLAYECKWLEEVRLTGNYSDYVTWSVNHAAQRRGLDFPINVLNVLVAKKLHEEEAPILLWWNI